MKAGYFVGIDRSDKVYGDKIVWNSKYEMMEEFMAENHISDTADLVFVGSDEKYDKDYQQKLAKALIRTSLVYLHGSDDPHFVSAARNTGLFGIHGPATGEIGGKLDMSLRDFHSKLKTELLPKRVERPSSGEVCEECGRSFPEEDGFRGVIGSDGVKRCFNCYLKSEAKKDAKVKLPKSVRYV